MRSPFHRASRLIQVIVVSSLVGLSALASPLYGRAQSLKVEHGLIIPNDHTPWAVDSFQNQPQLVPVHHSIVDLNRHTGENIAGELAGSFLYRPKITTELKGTSARTQLHTRTPVFYLLTEEDQDPDGENKSSEAYTYVIARTIAIKDKRVVDYLSYNSLGTNAKRREQFIETNTSVTPDGWTRIEPKQPMNEGEYCLLPVPKIKGTYSTEVFDFGIHLDAPDEKDAILARDVPPVPQP